MKTMGQLNLRMNAELLAAFAEIAEQTGHTPANLGVNVITDFIQIYHYKIQRGDITLSKPIIKKIFETIDPKKKQEIIDFTSDFIISEIRVQEGNPTYEIFLKHAMKWNKGRFQFNRIRQEESDLIVSKHSLCKMWSEIQCKIYAKCFEMVGETVLEMDYDSEDSYSIEVARHQ